jgi:hypothetical protein
MVNVRRVIYDIGVTPLSCPKRKVVLFTIPLLKHRIEHPYVIEHFPTDVRAETHACRSLYVFAFGDLLN